MKKQYISPELFMEHVELHHIICASVVETGGTADDIEMGGDEEGDEPVSGDSRRKDQWDDEEEESEKW